MINLPIGQKAKRDATKQNTKHKNGLLKVCIVRARTHEIPLKQNQLIR